jgi:molybdopterin-guanine dinucleotide biosynthesis protein A
MGTEKGLLQLGGVSLVERAVARLRPQVGKVIVSANGDPDRFENCAAPIVPDTIAGCGPLGGLLSGLRWAHLAGASFVLTAACDTPFFPPDMASRLRQSIGGDRSGTAVACSGGHAHYTFALHPTAFADELESWLGRPENRSLHGWLARRQPVWVTFEGDPDPFFNINAPMDLPLAEARARAFEKLGGKGMTWSSAS